MSVAGWIAIALGVLLTLALLANDIRVTLATEPYAGKKFGPELHVLAGALTGVGSGLLLGLWPGVGIGVGHTVIAFVIAVFVYRA